MAAASDPVVIVSAARTPLGRFMGDLSPFSAHKLGSHVIGAALERAKLAPERIDEVFMGCVLSAGQGQAPARQAARGAKLPRPRRHYYQQGLGSYSRSSGDLFGI
jgi:acetyl-CoA C-acetyltransferase